MLGLKDNPFVNLIKKEKWEIDYIKNEHGAKEPRVIVYDKDFPVTHPFFIHGKLYLKSEEPEIKYKHLVSMHDILWPKELWHTWTEERFWAHCEGWKYITLAAGASAAKSYDVAKLLTLFYWSSCRENAVVVASTTLKSIETRIWGYICLFHESMTLDLPHKMYSGNAPRIMYSKTDKIHGMFAAAAKRGDSEESIKDWIGRHPRYGLMVALDECTDMPTAVLGAMANLETSQFFQMLGIGNSSSEHDLHGMLSTPADGWDSVTPDMNRWLTKHKNGLCLYNNPNSSPAIHEPDIAKRELLGKFLITAQEIKDKKATYGEDSKAYWRFCMGYWKTGDSDETVISEKFLRELNVNRRAEWKGDKQLVTVGGLDVAFSTGGDKCILRLAHVGWDIHGDLLMDFYRDQLLFEIPISVSKKESPEAQIAVKVIELLRLHNVPINRLVVDATGQGRAIGEVIKLTANSAVSPLKIYHTRHGNSNKNSFDVIIRTPTEMWMTMRKFMQADMIRGMDDTTMAQLTSRRLIQNPKTLKQEIQSKRDYKSDMNAINPSMSHSPDEADSACLCLQAAILTAGFDVKNKSNQVLHQNVERGGEEALNHILQERLRMSDRIQENYQKPKSSFIKPNFASVRSLRKPNLR